MVFGPLSCFHSFPSVVSILCVCVRFMLPVVGPGRAHAGHVGGVIEHGQQVGDNAQKTETSDRVGST